LGEEIIEKFLKTEIFGVKEDAESGHFLML
jgi:hypothetical protein